MITLDTNIVVRLIVEDEPEQGEQARKIVDSNNCLLLLTVARETEWVLKSLYEVKPGLIAESIERVAGLPGMVIERGVMLSNALAAFRAGLDFGDALHLYCAEAEGAEAVATFDKKFAAHARRQLSTIAVVEF